jgi:acyl-coenzyme A thioesterase PaaI-like protein
MNDASTSARPTAAQILSDLKKLVRLYETLDLSVGIDGDRYWARMPLDDQSRSHVGTVHAAVQWAVAEVLGGVVVLHVFGGPAKVFLVVKHVSIDFVGPARTDVIAETTFTAAEGEELVKAVVEDGEAELELTFTVRDEAGEVVAEARGIYLLRPPRAAQR